MVRWCNILTAGINLCGLMVGACFLTVAISMEFSPLSSCHTLLIVPCVRMGSIIVTISFFGLLGSWCRSPFLLWIYLCLYFVIAFMMTVGVVLWSIIISRRKVNLEVGEVYRMQDFAIWFKDNVFGMTNWEEIRQCMIDRNLCSADSSIKNYFYKIQPVQDTCCNYPHFCPRDPINSTVADCHAWSTEKDKMCYYCDNCIGGFLEQVSNLWRKLFPGYVALYVCVLVILVIGWRAFQQHKSYHISKVCYTSKA